MELQTSVVLHQLLKVRRWFWTAFLLSVDLYAISMFSIYSIKLILLSFIFYLKWACYRLKEKEKKKGAIILQMFLRYFLLLCFLAVKPNDLSMAIPDTHFGFVFFCGMSLTLAVHRSLPSATACWHTELAQFKVTSLNVPFCSSSCFKQKINDQSQRGDPHT